MQRPPKACTLRSNTEVRGLIAPIDSNRGVVGKVLIPVTRWLPTLLHAPFCRRVGWVSVRRSWRNTYGTRSALLPRVFQRSTA